MEKEKKDEEIIEETDDLIDKAEDIIEDNIKDDVEDAKSKVEDVIVEGKKMTQEDLDKIITERASRMAKKELKDKQKETQTTEDRVLALESELAREKFVNEASKAGVPDDIINSLKESVSYDKLDELDLEPFVKAKQYDNVKIEKDTLKDEEDTTSTLGFYERFSSKNKR